MYIDIMQLSVAVARYGSNGVWPLFSSPHSYVLGNILFIYSLLCDKKRASAGVFSRSES